MAEVHEAPLFMAMPMRPRAARASPLAVDISSDEDINGAATENDEGEAEWSPKSQNNGENDKADEDDKEDEEVDDDFEEDEAESDATTDSTAEMEIDVDEDGNNPVAKKRKRTINEAISDRHFSGKKKMKRVTRNSRGEIVRNRRRQIAEVLADEDLEQATLDARAAEQQRASLAIDGILNSFSEKSDADLEVYRVCLNINADGKVPTGEEGAVDAPVYVHTDISAKLKKHQVVGARFLWSHIAVEPHGFGCVLADFMGLGKTLQVITVVQAFLAMKRRNSDGLLVPRHGHVLILAPTICVRNWEAEVVKWLGKKEARRMNLTTLESSREKKMTDRVQVVKRWYKRGGLLIMGYELYRLLVLQSSGDEKIAHSNQKHAHLIKQVYKYLSDPGPDLIVLDEGHRVRDHKSKLVKALSHVKTSRRIILTGYPLQNHLEEYWTMVNFARPDYLGTLDEFKNRFVDPIKNAQCVDSSDADLRLARQRAYVLTRELKPLVLRRDQQYLFSQLPPKKEWVFLCKLSDTQARLYRTFLERGVPMRGDDKVDVLGGYHISLAISNHPDVVCESFKRLENEVRNGVTKKQTAQKKRSPFSFSADDDDDDVDYFGEPVFSTGSKPKNSSTNGMNEDLSDGSEMDILNALESAPIRGSGLGQSVNPIQKKLSGSPQHRLSFAEEFIHSYTANQLEASGKMTILMQILSECQDIGDRVILFSQSIPTLNTIEKMIAQHNKTQKRHSKRLTFLRIDGSTPQQERFRQIGQFNDPEEDVDIIMISTKAGGEGINLCAGNRIIIFDVCWNPCNDSQSMCRSYRFGQTKPVFVYRFVTAGTMEKKVYDLQIRKEGVAKRIVDEKTIERKFKSTELQNYFNVDDFEESLKEQQQITGIDSRPPSETDVVLNRILARAKEERENGDSSCIIDWFEQETMFEEDLDQQCSPKEQKEIMESYQYLKAVRRLRKNGSHLISREGILVVQCQYCHVTNEIYPESTTKVPVPTLLDCSYCKRPTQTAGATPAPSVPSSGGIMYPFQMNGISTRGYGSYINVPIPQPNVVMPGAVPYRIDVGSAQTSIGNVPGLARKLPPHLQAIYDQQKAQESARQQAAVAADIQRQLVEQRKIQEQRRKERQSLKLSDRYILVLRRGMKGCQELKRAAESCGATIAIEVNSQLTDIVSAMSEKETLAWLKLTKLPRDVDFHDDIWLRNEIAKEKGLPPIAPSASSNVGSTTGVPIAEISTTTMTPSTAVISSPGDGDSIATDHSRGESEQTSVEASNGMIELLDSDDDSDDVTPSGPSSNRQRSLLRVQDTEDDDDDDVIEIL